MTATKTKGKEAKVEPVLNASARSAIVRAFSDALDSAENTGSVVTMVCNVAAKHLGGKALTSADVEEIARGVASARGWKGPSALARTSEVRQVLNAHEQLPGAITAFRERMGYCNYHQAVRLAREIRKAGGSATKAVKNAIQSIKAGGQSKGSTPQGRTAAALKAWYKAAKSDKRELILRAAQLLGLKLGVKLDA